MKLLAAILIGTAVASGCAHSPARAPSAMSTLPLGVSHFVQPDDHYHFFAWRTNDSSTAEFTMMSLPGPHTRHMLGEIVTRTEISFEASVTNVISLSCLHKEVAGLSIGDYEGKEITFIMRDREGATSYDVLYVLWDGDRIWQGQLIGPYKADVKIARDILKALPSLGSGK